MKVRAGGGWVGTLCVLVATAAWAPWAATPSAGSPKLDRRSFEARGRNEALLTVPRFGRVALLAKSPQGTGLQLVDRMSGPGPTAGQPGGADGRLDLLLDAGTYKVVTTSSERGQGELALSAKGFVELNPKAPLLLEERAVEGRLEDFQQTSYWLRIDQRRTVYLEAVGRDLADLRLWLEGNWLLDDQPEVTETSPVTGQPQTRCLLTVDLTPGTYLLTAYGGPAKPWPKETGEHPFCLRSGIPALDTNVRFQSTVSPFGRDRFLVPKESDTFILQLAEKRDFRLELKRFEAGSALEPPEATASIGKKSQDPECLLRFNTYKDFTLVTVVGPPGEPYDLQVFQRRETCTIRGDGRYWLSTLHSGFADDNIDATGILVSDAPQSPHAGAVAADVIPLGASKGWARRFNLLERENVFFYVEEAGSYEIRSEGTACVFRFEPFMVTTPPQYRSPEFRTGGSTWDLDPGYWVLQMEPQQKGVAAVAVRKKGGLWQTVTGVFSKTEMSEPGPAKGACRFPELVLASDRNYTLHVNRQEGVELGLVLRTLPLDLVRPLPVTLLPGEEVRVPFQASSAGRLEVVGPPGATAALQADGAPCDGGCNLVTGPHAVLLRNGGARTTTFTLRFTAAERLPGAPSLFLPAEVESQFNRFPVVTETAPLFLDLADGERKTTLLKVSAPGLYRIETTGLLATRCTLRARTQTRLFEDAGGGTGRNGLVQAYLRPGEYQVTVTTVGSSAGHLGLRIRRTELTEGVPLLLGGEVKEAIPAGAAVLHPFSIARTGTYALATVGVRKTYRCRLEDRDGWPIEAPGIPASLTRVFAPGDYRYLSLPWDVDTLRSTRLSEILPPVKAEGRGPHALTLNERLENVWREPPTGTERGRDLYDFTVTAELDAQISLGDPQMQAYLLRRAGAAPSRIGEIPPGKGWGGKLTPGDYRLEVECSRLNDLLPYAVTVTAAQLAPGLSATVKVPADLAVSVSRNGTVELCSSGTLDVRAKLYRDSDGALLDEDDDDSNDWNFRIARALAPGQYTLRVEPVGGGSGTVHISMEAPGEVERPTLALPTDETVALKGKINLLPLPVTAAGGLLVVRASGDSHLGCILEKVLEGEVRPLAERTGRQCEVFLPVPAGGRYRLRLWSRDHQSEVARVQAVLVSPPLLAEPDLRGAALRTVSAAGVSLAAARVQISAAGTFRVDAPSGVLVSRADEEALTAPPAELVGLPAGISTLAWKTEGAPEARVRAGRLLLGPGKAGALRLAIPGGAAEWVDVEPAGKGVTLVTASAETGVAGCAFDPPRASPPGPVLSGAYDFFDGGCVSATARGGPLRVLVWNGALRAPALPPAVLRSEFFPAPERDAPLPSGHTGGELNAQGASFYALPAGAKHLVLDLEEGLVALLEGDGPDAVLGARGEARHFALDTEASRLVVLNPSPSRALFSLFCLAGPPPEPSELRPGTCFERLCSEPGTIRLRLPDTARGDDPLVLTTGPGVAATVMGADGVLRSGNPTPLPAGGALVWLSHPGGAVTAWLAPQKEELSARWGAPLPEAVPSSSDASHALAGESAAFRLEVTEPGVLHAESEGPCVVGLRQGGASPTWLLVREGTGRIAADRFVEPGTYTVAVRGLAGRALAGALRTSFTPALRIADTFGPETLVGSGDSRTFAFSVRQAGSIGIGVQAGGERFSCDLLDPAGKLLGSGIQQFVHLEPGPYLLRVSVGPEAPPVRFRPVVVGLEPPGSGPPEEVLREFLAAIGASGKGE